MKTDITFPFSRPFACFVGSARALANAGTWGMSALSRMPSSGLDFENMPEDQKRIINNLPAMLYHGLPRRSGCAKPGVPRRSSPAKPGVNTEAGVLMRMNAVPRSIAVYLGDRFSATVKDGADLHSVRSARSYLRTLSPGDWQRSAPAHAKLSGDDYRVVWALLAGERHERRGGA